MDAKYVSEQTIERYLLNKVKVCDGITIKLVERKGWPDRLVLMRDYAAFFVELKRPKGGRLSAAQIRVHEKLRSLGFNTHVLNTKQSVDFMFFNFAGI